MSLGHVSEFCRMIPFGVGLDVYADGSEQAVLLCYNLIAALMDLDLDLTEPEAPKPCKASSRKTRYKATAACPRSNPFSSASSAMPCSLLASPQKKTMKRANVEEKPKDKASQDKSKGKYNMSNVENLSAKKSQKSKDKSLNPKP